MPLDESTHRLAFLLQRDLRRVVEREVARAERGEVVTQDPGATMVTWESKRGEVIGRWYAEILATYDIRDRIFRWAWAGRVSQAAPAHIDVVAREGIARNVPQLAMSVVGDLTPEEAVTLARLGLVVARGESMQIRESEGELALVGLFDAPRPRSTTQAASHWSVPPPAETRRSSPPRHYASVPPIQEVYAPRTKSLAPPASPMLVSGEPVVAVREPARAIFVPVATAMLAALTRQAAGFQQGLFVIHPDRGGRGLTVTLVAVDASGVLRALDPPTELVEATRRMIDADHTDGNGPWRKLSARVLPKSDGGATLHVDVI